jgi:hypothetical protein
MRRPEIIKVETGIVLLGLKDGVLATDSLVIDGHVTEIVQSTDKVEGFLFHGQLPQHAAVLDDFKTA